MPAAVNCGPAAATPTAEWDQGVAGTALLPSTLWAAVGGTTAMSSSTDAGVTRTSPKSWAPPAALSPRVVRCVLRLVHTQVTRYTEREAFTHSRATHPHIVKFKVGVSKVGYGVPGGQTTEVECGCRGLSR